MRIKEAIHTLGFSFGSELDNYLDLRFSGDQINFIDFKYLGEDIAVKIADASAGIRVFIDNNYLDQENYLGLAIYKNSNSKYSHRTKSTILVSSKISACSSALVFLHELGHCLDTTTLQTAPNKNENNARESFANAFAFFFVLLLNQKKINIKGFKKIIPIGADQALDKYHNDNRYCSFDFPYSDFIAFLKVQEIFRNFEQQKPFYFLKFDLKKAHKNEIKISNFFQNMGPFERLLFTGRMCDIDKNENDKE